MNKFGMVFGLAAVATLAGCKDPDYVNGQVPKNEVKSVETTPTPEAKPIENDRPAPVIEEEKPAKTPSVTADLSAKPEEEYTIYIVQKGDYLAKISKKFNVTISSIKRLNPSIKKDVVRLGQKLKLPGKLDVGVQEEPKVVTAAEAKKSVKKAFAPYTGATKEYVVKNGDTLGAIAYGNGITIRQLKNLNGLSSDTLKVGQKLKIPAEKVVKAATPKVTKVEAAVEPAVKSEPVVESEKTADAAADAAAATPAATVEPTVKAAADVAPHTYEVQEGDDITGISISWGVEPAQIREINELADGDKLVPGQIIKLPAGAAQQ